MTDVPVIVISSPQSQSGKTTLALNLAAALWSDNYQVEILSPDKQSAAIFLQKRQELNEKHNLNLYMPTLLNKLSDSLSSFSGKKVIIADVPSTDNLSYQEIFNQAHTLITIVNRPQDIMWKPDDTYINLVWNAKKDIAARGIKYLNWITIANLYSSAQTDWSNKLEETARRYGFRISPALHFREAYQHINEGFCTADMVKNHQFLPMQLSDVYARREILQLADILWRHK